MEQPLNCWQAGELGGGGVDLLLVQRRSVLDIKYRIVEPGLLLKGATQVAITHFHLCRD